MTTAQHEKLGIQTADIVKQYQQAAYSKLTDIGLDNIIHDMLGGTDYYADHIYNYELQMRFMIQAMAQPSACKALEEYLGHSLQKDIIRMLGELILFFQRLQDDAVSDQLHEYDLRNHYDGYTQERLIRLQIEYKSKLAGVKAQLKEEEKLNSEAQLKAV